MAKKKKILFIHDAYPNQLSAIHEYFRETGKAESYFLTQEVSRANRQFGRRFLDHVYSYMPDGQLGDHSYYYSGEAEKIARNAVNVLKAVKGILQHHPLDLIVSHDRSGHAYFLFDSLGIPVVTYSEFPDFKSYGWDERYPPVEEQIQATLMTQAYSYQSVVKSAVTIVPSEYARRMYPEPIRQKVVAQMDAFDAEQRRVYHPKKAAFKKENGLTYIGFASNVLSSEKGLEYFIEISKKIYAANDTVRFVLVGSEMDGGRYGYEPQFLDKTYGKDKRSFLDYLFEKYNVDRTKYIITGLLADEVFSSTLYHIDFFLYPLQYGSANWGLFELLIRGKIVIASDRCYVPEIITNGVNGYMLDSNDHAAWVKRALDIVKNPKKYKRIAESAMALSHQYHVDQVAKNYLKIFDEWVWKKSVKG